MKSLPKQEVFSDSLYAAKNHLQKAWGFVTEGYDKSECPEGRWFLSEPC